MLTSDLTQRIGHFKSREFGLEFGSVTQTHIFENNI